MISTTLFFGVGTTLLVLANSQGGLPDWAQYGILGVLLIAIITKQIVPGWAYRDLEERVKSLDKENNDLVNAMLAQQEKILPALAEGTLALKESQEEIRRLRRER